MGNSGSSSISAYWEAPGRVGRLWEPLCEGGWRSGIGWGSSFWAGFSSGEGPDPRLGVQGWGLVFSWGLSEGRCESSGSGSQMGIQAGIWGTWGTIGVWIVGFHIPGLAIPWFSPGDLGPGLGSGSWNSGGFWVLSGGPGLGWGSGNWAVVRIQVGFWMLGMDLGPGVGSGFQVGVLGRGLGLTWCLDSL